MVSRRVAGRETPAFLPARRFSANKLSSGTSETSDKIVRAPPPSPLPNRPQKHRDDCADRRDALAARPPLAGPPGHRLRPDPGGNLGPDGWLAGRTPGQTW